MKNKTSLTLVYMLILLQSCTLTPKYNRPNMDIPDDYRLHLNSEKEEEESNYELNCKAANVRFWEQFGDPVLDQLIINALANNNDLKIAVARVDEFYGIVGIVSSALYPQLGGNVSKNRQQYSLRTEPPLSPIYRRVNTYSTLLNASYEIDIWGKIQSQSDSAYMDYLRQIEVRRTVVLTLVSQVANSYIQLIKFDKQLKISINTLNTRIEAERIARVRFEQGLTSELPLKQAQSETEAAVIAIKILEISIPQQENLISVLIGKPPESIERGKPLDMLIMPETVPVGLPSQLLSQRPDILEAEDLLIATNFDIGTAKAEFFPDFSLSAYFGNQSAKLKHLMDGKAVTFGVLIDMFQPIFTGGRLLAQLEVAKSRNNQALYNYLNIVLNALREVNDALIAHKKNLELVVEQANQVQIFKEYRYLAELQYNNGESDYLNVLDAERKLFEAELLLADREANGFISLINLYKALGGGWVIDADNFNRMVDNGC